MYIFENDDNKDEDITTKPRAEEVLKAIEILEDFSLLSNFGEAMMKSLKDLDNSVQRELLLMKKQSVISVFFLENRLSR